MKKMNGPDPLDISMAAIKAVLERVLEYQGMDDDEIRSQMMPAEPKDEMLSAEVIAEDPESLKEGLEEASELMDEDMIDEMIAGIEDEEYEDEDEDEEDEEDE